MNTHIGDKIYLDTLRRVEKFCENRTRDVEKSVVGNCFFVNDNENNNENILNYR